MYRVFGRLLAEAGVGKTPRGGRPRLHDLRHRFAVHTLIEWYRTGKEIEPRLPMLATFLGHVSVESTYWYLSEHPELMQLAAQRLDLRWRGDENRR
jgi:integrase